MSKLSTEERHASLEASTNPAPQVEAKVETRSTAEQRALMVYETTDNLAKCHSIKSESQSLDHDVYNDIYIYDWGSSLHDVYIYDWGSSISDPPDILIRVDRSKC